MSSVTRWLPRERLGRLTAAWLLLAIVCAAASLAVDAIAGERDVAARTARSAVERALYDGGLQNPALPDVLKRVAQDMEPLDLLALVDPASGRVAAAYPPQYTGQLVQDISIAGLRLPGLPALLSGGPLLARRNPPPDRSAGIWGFRWDRIVLRAFTFSRWSPADTFLVDAPNSGPALTEAVLVLAAPPQGVTLFSGLAAGLGIAAGLFGLAYWLSLAWWVFQDARRRQHRPLPWGLLTLLINAVGLAVYLVVRRERRHCPACGGLVRRSYHHCPHCGEPLRSRCIHCGHALQADWEYCPGCGTVVVGEAE